MMKTVRRIEVTDGVEAAVAVTAAVLAAAVVVVAVLRAARHAATVSTARPAAAAGAAVTAAVPAAAPVAAVRLGGTASGGRHLQVAVVPARLGRSAGLKKERLCLPYWIDCV